MQNDFIKKESRGVVTLGSDNRLQWDNLAKKYGEEVLAQRYILIPNAINTILPTITRGSIVLDIGCGNGLYSKMFTDVGAEVLGVDISPEQIKIAKDNNPDGNFFAGTIESVEGINSYNIIFANMLICNLPSTDSVISFLDKSYDLLVDGGTLYITNVAKEFQKTCETGYVKHLYQGKVVEGSELDVELRLTDGTTIGPFKNYHYSPEFLVGSAQCLGYSTRVGFINSEGEDTSMQYQLFIFQK